MLLSFYHCLQYPTMVFQIIINTSISNLTIIRNPKINELVVPTKIQTLKNDITDTETIKFATEDINSKMNPFASTIVSCLLNNMLNNHNNLDIINNVNSDINETMCLAHGMNEKIILSKSWILWNKEAPKNIPLQQQ